MNVVSIFLDNARRYSTRMFLIDGDERITYGEMADRVCRLGRGLMALGVRPGEVVGIYCRNRYEWVEAFYAISWIGGIVCPINFRLRGKELTHVINHSEASYLIYDQGNIPDLQRAVVGQAPGLKQFIHLDDALPEVESLPLQSLFVDPTGESELVPGRYQPPPHLIRPEEIHMILYTSGTTGLAKGCLITHAISLTATVMNVLEFEIGREDCILVGPPLCHRTGMNRILNAAMVGAACVLVREFRPDAAMDLVEREGVTALGVVPTMIRMILRLPDLEKWRRDKVRAIVLTGEACPPPLKEGMMHYFPNAEIFTYLASTEASQVTSLRGTDQIRKSMSVGQPMPGVELIVVNENGESVPPGTDGEIWVRSGRPGEFLTMKGYHKNPVADQEHFTGDWFHTGDGGRFDEEGYLYMTDRKKDMILSGGLNIYSKEVENAIADCSGVLEAAVVGVPDPEWGEAVMAFVVPVPGQTVTESEIIAYCKENLASYKKPRYLRFVTQLPKNSVGKVLKYELREMGKQQLADVDESRARFR